MHPILQLGGYQLPAYILCALLAALTGVLMAASALREAGLSRRRALLLLLVICAAFLVGARLWNVLVSPWNFSGERRWYSLSMFGLSLYGGLLGAFLPLLLLLRLWKQSAWPMLDAFVIPGGTAFAIARVGCFLNGCCAGKATNSPLGVVFPTKAASQQALAELVPFFKADYAVHPTQLYELAGALIGLPLAVWLARRLRLRPGGRFLLYSAWFSAVRLLVLPLRVLPYTAAVKDVFYPILYVTLIVVGIVLLLMRQRRKLPATRRKDKSDEDRP